MSVREPVRPLTDAAGHEPVLDVSGLSVSFRDGRAWREVVHGIDLTVDAGRCVAVVGESGSGKSVTARALLGLAGRDARVRAERLTVAGADLRDASEREWRRIRGARAGLVLQDALVSLDPLRTIGREIADPFRLHLRMPPAEARARALELLELVGMPHPALTIDRRSGELSGGMRQRALIAAALALDPPLLIADEPTTALDVGVQARVLGLLEAARDRGTGVLLISHDLAVVSRVADQVVVLHDGRVVEQGPTAEILGEPRHPITRALIAAVPTEVPRGTPLSAADAPSPAVTERRADAAGATPSAPQGGPVSTPILEGVGITKTFGTGETAVLAVDDASFRVDRGRTLGLVGESGSGKSTLARMVLALTTPDAGEVRLDGDAWSTLGERERRPLRPRLGAVYQDAFGSFDPRWNVRRILRDALAVARVDTSDAAVGALLEQVHLGPEVASRHPLALSGGQRQRVAIARALAGSPEALVCDEPVSALDATVQARVLDLLDEIQRERGLALLLISHDLGVIRHMSDTIAVMRSGRIIEQGDAERVFRAPEHEITAALIRDSPRLVTRGPGSNR